VLFAIGALGALVPLLLIAWRWLRHGRLDPQPARVPLPLSAGLLWLLAVAVQYAAWLRPTTPIFGGTKHWMTAYPFVALLAGVGLAQCVRSARTMWRSTSARRLVVGRQLEWMLLAAALAAPLVMALHAHPWGLSSYTPLVGGAAGGADLGLNRGFWGYTTGSLAKRMSDELPRATTVYPHDTAGESWRMLVRDGRTRSTWRARSIKRGSRLAHAAPR
jgi:hypothetical protein